MGNNILLAVLIVMVHLQLVTSRNKCKLKKHATQQTYFLSCDGLFEDTERTTNLRRDKKDKKSRKGLPGLPGPQGPPGQSGVDGFDGASGSPGPMGPTGPTGVPGRRGLTGHKGSKGDKGDFGLMGPQGPSGVPGNCIKDSPTLFKKDSAKQYHCIAGPQGSQGPKGDRGTLGMPGTQGMNGVKGDEGEKGHRGRRGPAGMPGLPGTTSNINCEMHFTEWVGRFSHLENRSFEGFFCPDGEFLQGFKIQKDGIKERYQYRCCRLG